MSINTLNIYTRLRAVGLTEEQAELQARTLWDVTVNDVFDKSEYAAKLKSAGFTNEQAELMSDMLAEIVEKRRAAKSASYC